LPRPTPGLVLLFVLWPVFFLPQGGCPPFLTPLPHSAPGRSPALFLNTFSYSGYSTSHPPNHLRPSLFYRPRHHPSSPHPPPHNASCSVLRPDNPVVQLRPHMFLMVCHSHPPTSGVTLMSLQNRPHSGFFAISYLTSNPTINIDWNLVGSACIHLAPPPRLVQKDRCSGPLNTGALCFPALKIDPMARGPWSPPP